MEMGKPKMFLVFSCLSFFQAFLMANAYYCGKSLVPALYVFGDSSVDAGNNNNLNTPAKANIFPYGIDFNNCSTGRFTNGKTFADIIAIKLGLPMPPPYLGISENERSCITTGINYASASCGILNETRAGGCLSLGKQIEYFSSTVEKDLPKQFQSDNELRDYLSKSIYLVSIGSNDYVLNYFKGNYKKYNPEEFADYLLFQLGYHIQRLYEVGARKFVMIGIGPIGCIPENLISKRPYSQDCNENMNQKLKPFSLKFPLNLQHLQHHLSGSLFITLDSFNFFFKIRKCPQKYGFTNMSGSCAVKGGKACEKRRQYYFFDFAHTTEAANEVYAHECFSGNHLSFPLNILNLVQP